MRHYLKDSLFISRAGTRVENFQMSSEDFTVLALGAATVTTSWWAPLVEWLPDVLKILITFATIVYVIARAYNEVDKVLVKLREKRELRELLNQYAPETQDDAELVSDSDGGKGPARDRGDSVQPTHPGISDGGGI